MAKTSSVVEINGIHYDAVSGQVLGTVKKVAQQVKRTPSGVIDGIVRSRAAVSVLQPAASTKQATPTRSAKEHASRARHPAQSVHKKTQKSRTLMRAVVSKPQIRSEAPKAGQIHTGKLRSMAEIKRAVRAENVKKHAKIKKFAAIEHNIAYPPPPPATKHPATGKQSVPALPSLSARPLTSITSNMSSQQLERLLDQALTRADSHKQSRPGRSAGPSKLPKFRLMPRWAAIGASALIVILAGGFFAWNNVPELSVRLAAARANLPVSLPGYAPAGFSVSGPASYSKGGVSISFRAKNDSYKTFTITQQKSALDSQALEASVPRGSQVQTAQINGTTVYIYGPSNDATWVDGGIKYTLKDQASLTSDQILKIAGSM